MPFINATATQAVTDWLLGRANAQYSEEEKLERAEQILDSVRDGKYTPMNLPFRYFSEIFSIVRKCTAEEYNLFEKAFRLRVTPEYYENGLEQFLSHADDVRIERLFDILLQLMQKMKPEIFSKTIFARCGLPVSKVYRGFYSLTAEENALADAIFNRYEIPGDCRFAGCLRLSYTAQSIYENINDMTPYLPEYLRDYDLRVVRPAVGNYMRLVPFEKVPLEIVQAIYDRLMNENKSETLEMNRETLDNIRSFKFRSILMEVLSAGSAKLKVYSSLTGNIRKIIRYEHGYFSAEFNKYIVMDNEKWESKACAFTSEAFEERFEQWKNDSYPEKYWETVLNSNLPTAHDVLLKIKDGCAVLLGFEQFERLYTKDILTKV